MPLNSKHKRKPFSEITISVNCTTIPRGRIWVKLPRIHVAKSSDTYNYTKNCIWIYLLWLNEIEVPRWHSAKSAKNMRMVAYHSKRITKGQIHRHLGRNQENAACLIFTICRAASNYTAPACHFQNGQISKEGGVKLKLIHYSIDNSPMYCIFDFCFRSRQIWTICCNF